MLRYSKGFYLLMEKPLGRYFQNCVLIKYQAAQYNWTSPTLAIIHKNISFLPVQANDLKTFLNLLNTNFNVICIYESRISAKTSLTTSINICGYNIEQTPTESTARGNALMYVSQKFHIN